MQPRTTRKLLRVMTQLCMSLLLIASNAFAEPAQSPRQTLTRTEQSGLQLGTTLTKNIYRQEPYQAEYTERIPYEVEVPYTDYEEYYENEYRCNTDYEQQCGYENVCRSVPDRECRQERVCRPTPGRENCQMVEECGTNALGEPICKTRKVCTSEPGGEDCDYVERCSNTSRQECGFEERCSSTSRQECGYEERCSNTTRQECSNEYQCRQVPRERCGYENVRKTRPVTKYRTETRYREETRCCVTKYKDVYERQDALQLNIKFPQGTELVAGETEQFEAEFLGEAGRADLGLKALKAVFGYKIANKSIQGSNALVELALVPRFTEEQLGPGTISGISLDAGQLIFIDKGNHARITSVYKAKLIDKSSGAVIATASGQATAKDKISLPIAGNLIEDVDYKIVLQVTRTGLVLPKGQVQFSAEGSIQFERINPTDFTREDLVSQPDIQGSKKSAILVFKDRSPKHKAVKTVYQIELIRPAGFLGTKRETMLVKNIDREQVSQSSDGTVKLKLTTDLGLDGKTAERYISDGRTVYVNLKVIRQSARLNGGKNIEIAKSEKLRIQE
ncbi:MAG: hypothetical protein ACK5RO_01265 [Pseudobdellovibrionaceae bacterium]